MDQALEVPDTTKAQLGADRRDSINGIKHKICEFLRKMLKGAKMLGKC